MHPDRPTAHRIRSALHRTGGARARNIRPRLNPHQPTRMKSNTRHPRRLLPPTLLALGTLLVGACGGSADPEADQATAGRQAGAGSQQALADARNGTGTSGTGVPGSPNTPVMSVAGVTSVSVQSTASTAQWSVPVSFGQVFAKGDLKSTERLSAQVGTERLPLQLDVKARHADGSVRHAVLSAVLPQLAAGANPTLALVKSNDAPPRCPARARCWARASAPAWSSTSVAASIGRQQMSCSRRGAPPRGCRGRWCRNGW